MNSKLFLLVCVFVYCGVVYGQINTGEAPISFSSNVPILTKSGKTMKSFASLDMKKIEQEDEENDKKGVPPRFGYPHEVNYTLENSGEWVGLPGGDKIWRLVISCQDALSINLLYDKFWLPDGAKFFVYGKNIKHTIGAITSANNKGDKDNIQGFATGLVYGDQITLEYYLPKGTKEIGVISVACVVHGYRYIHDKIAKAYGGSGSCNININCNQGQSWQNEKNAVAMVLINGTNLCSGSLVNTTANDARPLFLTANHCLNGADAITAPNLNFWSFYWHYESPGCISTNVPLISTSGAVLVANNSGTDFALLRLTENPRDANGVKPYYLGWDRSGNSGTGGVGIHHPIGDIKKISLYSITPPSITYDTTTTPNGHWRIVWSNGTTEKGSSGSTLINSNRKVIGQLHGGRASCSNTSGYDYYGKFSISWTGNGNQDIRRRLNHWLDPNNTGVSVLDGCPGVMNYSNAAVVGNTFVSGCAELNVQSTVVQPTGALNLRATQKVTINPYFSVMKGGTLNVMVP